MLRQMREAQSWMIKGVLWAVVMAFVVTIFYSWGVQSTSGPSRTEVATIFGKPIGVQVFQQTQNALYQSYRQLFRNQPDVDLREHFNFREMALEQLVREALLLRMAQQEGVVVTDRELYEHIARIAAFQEDGHFSPQRYEAVLRSQVPPIPPQKFEAEQRQALLRNKVSALVQEGVQVSDGEIEQAYRLDHQQVAVRYVSLVPSVFEPQVTLTDETIQEYYESHRETYREPEQRQLRYVVISLQRFSVAREFLPEEIEAYYTQHQETFRQPEKVHVRHILFKVEDGATNTQEQAVRERAEQVLLELREGADFATAAAEHSEDTTTAAAGGDLGFFPRGQMVKPFEEVAFTLAPGEMSDLVRTSYGFHILRVEAKSADGIPPLGEVQQQVIAKLQQEKAEEALVTFVDDLVVGLEEQPERFEEIAQQHALTVVTTPFLPVTGQLPEVKGVPDLIKKAFALPIKGVETARSPEGEHYLVQVAEIRQPEIPTLEAVRERVVEDARRQQAIEMANKKADEMAEQVKAGASLQELATALHLEVNETGLFARRDPIPRLGRLPAFTRTAFELSPGGVSAIHEGAQTLVLQVMEQREADMANYEAAKATYRSNLLTRKRQQRLQAFQQFLTDQFHVLQQQGEIVVNSQYVF